MRDGVGAAAPDFGHQAGAEQGEAQPGLIFKAVAFGGIERDGDAVQAISQRGNRIQSRQYSIGQIKLLQRRQCTVYRASSGDQRHILIGTGGAQGADILAVQPGLHVTERRTAQRPAGSSEIGNQRWHGEIDRKPGEARGGQRLHGDGQHLGGGGRAVAADQFGASLGALAFGRKLITAHARHLPGIHQPQRTRLPGKAGDGDAANLAGDVGTQRQRHLADRIGEAQAFAAAATGQAGFIFDQRRRHPFITMGGAHIGEGAHQAG